MVAHRLTPKDEGALISAALRGDTNAYGELVGIHQARVYHLCLRFLGHCAEAQDAAQETFLAAYRALSRFEEGRALRPWLVTIASRICLNLLRRRRRGREVELEETCSEGPGPEELAQAQFEKSRVERALDHLREVPRAVVVLFYLEDRSVAQVAEILSLSPSAVKVTLHRAREQLRGLLKESV